MKFSNVTLCFLSIINKNKHHFSINVFLHNKIWHITWIMSYEFNWPFLISLNTKESLATRLHWIGWWLILLCFRSLQYFSLLYFTCLDPLHDYFPASLQEMALLFVFLQLQHWQFSVFFLSPLWYLCSLYTHTSPYP